MKNTQFDSYTFNVRIRIHKLNTVIYGTGVSELLQETDHLHSLHGAAKKLDIPYKKALYIVKRAEEEFGKKILEKSIGGVGGGGSRLTEFGRYLVYQFHVLEEDLGNYLEELVHKYFPLENDLPDTEEPLDE